ncbi:MAG: damage-control phosphatase ARMT1 family protein [Candidatus Heimdallarchaeaceae archaeon]
MQAREQCIPCMRKQAERTLSILKLNNEDRQKILHLVDNFLANTKLSRCPMEIAQEMNRIIERETGILDPYETVKYESNKKALSLLPLVSKLLSQYKDELFGAIKASIAGNIIDYGIRSNYNLEQTLLEVFNKEPIINHYFQLKKELEKANVLTLLADNAGEIVFDIFLLEIINKKYPLKTTNLVVKKVPFINDVTQKELNQLDLSKIKNLQIIEIDNEKPNQYQQSIRSILDSSDVIISKGQGNFELFYNEYQGIFFLFMIKCSFVGETIGQQEGEYVILYK